MKLNEILLSTDHVHVDSVCVRPRVLEILFEALAKWIRDLMKPDEFLHLLHLSVVARRARVQPLYNRTHVAEDARVHQRCIADTPCPSSYFFFASEYYKRREPV